MVARSVSVVAGPGARAMRVFVAGDLDLASVEEAEQVVAEALRELVDLEVDLAGVTFIDAAGLRAVDGWHARAAASGVRCDVVARSRVVRRVQQLAAPAAGGPSAQPDDVPAELGPPAAHA